MFSHRTAWSLTANPLASALEEHRRAGRELLDLTASNPTRVGLQYDEPALLSALQNPQSLTYDPQPKGMLSARRAVADYYCEPSEPSPVDPEQIVLTVSTSEAYSFAFRLLCDPGDEVLVPTPSYPLFEFLADLHDVRLVPYELIYDHGWYLDVHSLEAALTGRARAIMLVHPNNPTGSYVKPHESRRLNAICAAQDLALVADEVFLDFSLAPASVQNLGESIALPAQHSHPSNSLECGFDLGKAKTVATNASDLRPRSFAFNRQALTLTLSGISKISALPQMKFAWIVVSGPDALVTPAISRLEIIADTYLSQNTPVQLAAPALLAQRHSMRAQLLARVRANLAELDRQLENQSLSRRLEVEGGWYAIVRVPATRSDEELALELLRERQVLVQPGYFYDFAADGYIVLSLITPEHKWKEGVRRILATVS